MAVTPEVNEIIATEKRALTEPEEVVAYARAQGIKMVDFRFSDLPGTWQHFSIPIQELSADCFRFGLGFDGSSIRGFQKIHESDMLLMPDPTSAFIDPTLDVPTLDIVCDIVDPVTKEPYSRDPRHVAKKAEAYLASTGIATTSYWGPEAEFYIFNDIRFDQTSHSGFYFIDSEEGIWNSGQNGGKPNLGFRPRYKEGYFPVPPMDKLQDLRSEMVMNLIASGIDVEIHHHEVGTAGQSEIDMKYKTMTFMGDQVMKFKYIIRNTAYKKGYTATFMPKPLFGDSSGMPCIRASGKMVQISSLLGLRFDQQMAEYSGEYLSMPRRCLPSWPLPQFISTIGTGLQAHQPGLLNATGVPVYVYLCTPAPGKATGGSVPRSSSNPYLVFRPVDGRSGRYVNGIDLRRR